MFLNKEELQDFTGCYSSRGQIHWLKANKIKHFVNALGEPIVTKVEADSNKKIIRRKDMFSTKEAILKTKRLPRNACGIYFLISENEIIYVGKTTDFFSRIASHSRGEIPFCSVSFIQIEEKLLDIFEVEFIKKFKPKYNTVHNN